MMMMMMWAIPPPVISLVDVDFLYLLHISFNVTLAAYLSTREGTKLDSSTGTALSESSSSSSSSSSSRNEYYLGSIIALLTAAAGPPYSVNEISL